MADLGHQQVIIHHISDISTLANLCLTCKEFNRLASKILAQYKESIQPRQLKGTFSNVHEISFGFMYICLCVTLLTFSYEVELKKMNHPCLPELESLIQEKRSIFSKSEIVTPEDIGKAAAINDRIQEVIRAVLDNDINDAISTRVLRMIFEITQKLKNFGTIIGWSDKGIWFSPELKHLDMLAQNKFFIPSTIRNSVEKFAWGIFYDLNLKYLQFGNSTSFYQCNLPQEFLESEEFKRDKENAREIHKKYLQCNLPKEFLQTQ